MINIHSTDRVTLRRTRNIVGERKEKDLPKTSDPGAIRMRGKMRPPRPLLQLRYAGDRTPDSVSRHSNIPQPASQPSALRRTKIEQPRYVCGNSQHDWIPQNPIDFLINGQPGVRLTDALDPHFWGPDGRDDEILRYPGAGSSISCRINVC